MSIIPNTVLPITMMDSKLDSLTFDLPSNLEAGEPPEARGLSRDQVRLMVSWQRDDAIEHIAFRDLPDVLHAGDVVVINTSGTRKASLPIVRPDGTELRLHLSTQLPADMWAVEVRQPNDIATLPFYSCTRGRSLYITRWWIRTTARALSPRTAAHSQRRYSPLGCNPEPAL